ncbi:COG3014 family protein [Pseudomonas sp. USHLN015]|uniref:COG3014 family protein n=1 Tax=Pseudomonas sp. USHLN015 TaxID=3081296 RepID=UPI00301CFE82
MASRALTALAACFALQLAGCSVLRSYESELTATSQHLARGEVDAALGTLEANNSGEDKDLLYYFEKGELLRARGDLTGSQAAWRQADRIVFQWEEAMKADPSRYLGQAGAFLANDRVRRYEGYDYEKVMLTTQMALNDLAVSDFDAARTEIRKTHEREALIAELRDRQYLDSEEEAERQGISTRFEDLRGYPVASLDAPDVVNLKNSYQSAFSHYLAGFVYEALGEKGLAAPGYRQAAELRPGTPLLEQALLDLDATPAADAGSDVLLVLQSGLAPARDSLRIPLPVPLESGMIISTVSFPLLRDDTSTPAPAFVEVDGTPTALTELSSVRAMSHRALRDDMPGIILRTTVRAVTRGALQKQLNDNGNALASLAVGIMSVASEGADERTWRTLPGSIGVARLRLAMGEHRLALPTAHGVREFTLKIDRPHQVVPLRLVAGQVYAQGAVTPTTPGVRAVASNQTP